MLLLKLRGLLSPRFARNLLPVPPTNRCQRGQKVPDFVLPDATNRTTVRLSDYQQKKTFYWPSCKSFQIRSIAPSVMSIS